MMVRDKLKQVVVIAIARELAGFVWAIACITSDPCPGPAKPDVLTMPGLTTQPSRLSGMHGGGREPVTGQSSTIALELRLPPHDRGRPATHHGLAVTNPRITA